MKTPYIFPLCLITGQYLSTVVLAGGGSLPSFIKPPGDQTGVYGGVASFVCQAEGEPRPQVTWTKRGKAVSHQRFEVIEFDAGSGSVLRIQPLRTPRDEAIYDCTATNSVGTITTSAKLTVLEEDKVPQGFPTIDMGPHLKVVERMRTATMICAASGQPDPEISWFKDFLPVNINGSNGRIKQLDSGALQIEESEESDQGKYECVAMNSAGTRYSAPANLYVRVRRVPPRFAILPTHQVVMPGSNVNLPCVAVGSPMPHVKWTAGGVDLTKENEMPVGRNVLELTNILQSANYTCVAMSPLGVIETTAHITVEDVDECKEKPPDCGPRGTCTNTPGSYTCSCQQGFRNHGNNRGPCEDVNECMESPPDCGPHGNCRNTPGSYTCSCPEGFRNHGNNSTGPCEDVNECVESPPDCGPRGTCRNTPGSYVCSCPEGLRNHGNNSTGPCEEIRD